MSHRIPLTASERLFLVAGMLAIAFAAVLVGYILMAGVLQ